MGRSRLSPKIIGSKTFNFGSLPEQYLYEQFDVVLCTNSPKACIDQPETGLRLHNIIEDPLLITAVEESLIELAYFNAVASRSKVGWSLKKSTGSPVWTLTNFNWLGSISLPISLAERAIVRVLAVVSRTLGKGEFKTAVFSFSTVFRKKQEFHEFHLRNRGRTGLRGPDTRARSSIILLFL